MSSTNLTPLEILQIRKKRLKAESGELAGSLKENADYLFRNIVPLVGGNAVSTVTKGLLDVLPFFFKGKRSLIAGLLLQLIKKKLFRE